MGNYQDPFSSYSKYSNLLDEDEHKLQSPLLAALSQIPTQEEKDARTLNVPEGMAERFPAAIKAKAPISLPPERDVSSTVSDAIKQQYGYPEDLNQESLKDAQALAQSGRSAAGYGQAFGTLAHAISGSNQPVDNSFYQNLAKEGQAPEADILARRKAYTDDETLRRSQALKDPDSIESKVAQNIAIKQGLDPATAKLLSAQDLKDFGQTGLTAYENAQARKLMASMRGDQQTDKRLTALGDALDPNKGRTGQFGKQQQVVDSADRLLVLRNQNPSLNFDKRQMEELAIGSANLLTTGSQTAQSVIHSLLPKTLKGDASSIYEWFSNKPEGTEQQAFARRMLETAEREKALAQDKIKGIQLSRVAQFPGLEKNPAFSAILASHGIEPEDYERFKKGGFKQNYETSGKPNQINPNTRAVGTTARPPGSIIKVRGKSYKVGADGDSLIPVEGQ